MQDTLTKTPRLHRTMAYLFDDRPEDYPGNRRSWPEINADKDRLLRHVLGPELDDWLNELLRKEAGDDQ